MLIILYFILHLNVVDCQSTSGQEPMEGLRHLVMGAAQCCLGHTTEAIACFRTSIAKRSHLDTNAGDNHITAFALYELGILLCKESQVTILYLKKYFL